MNRREFVTMSVAIATLGGSRMASAQTVSSKAAVVIGVDQAGYLPKLEATDGAKLVADWLKDEGFDVRRFLDTQQKVKQSDIFDAIAEFVGRGNVEMLVLYFAGHGFMSNGYNEWWMLSDAPQNPNEAISVIETVTQSKLCGIPNVVIISDACRSTPDSLQAGGVRGVIVFPNISGARSGRVDVDRFSATSAGDRAFELPVSESVKRGYQGIFTASFLDAFARPDDNMVKALPDGTLVVPNRDLSGFLEREVPKRGQQKSIMIQQVPDIDVTSKDLVYIGKAKGRQHSALRTPIVPTNVIVDFALREAGAKFTNGGLLSMSAENITHVDISDRADQIGFNYVRDAVASNVTSEPFRQGTGIFFPNAVPIQVQAFSEGKFEVSPSPDPSSRGSFIGVSLPGTSYAMNLAVRFEDGTGTVITAIDGHIGNVTRTEGGGISNVSYVPATDTQRTQSYTESMERLVRLQSVFAAASSVGALRIKGSREEKVRSAQSMAQDIRFGDRPDITLGLYAGYAFWAADLQQELGQLTRELDDLLKIPLFDLHLLSTRDRPIRPDAPMFPMLSQGWDLLRVLNASNRITDSLKPYLVKSVWTSFSAPGADLLFASAQLTPR